MSIIHGSRGIIYFVHEFRPKFIEAGLLAHPEQAMAIKQVNRQILELAAVINRPEPAAPAKASSSDPEVPIAVMTREYQGAIYVFAVGMRNKQTTVTFELPRPVNGQIEVIDERRSLPVRNGRFHDEFKPYEVHLYRLTAPAQP